MFKKCLFLQKILDFYELSDGNDLQKLISQLQARIEKTKQKIAAANTAEDTVTEVTINGSHTHSNYEQYCNEKILV